MEYYVTGKAENSKVPCKRVAYTLCICILLLQILIIMGFGLNLLLIIKFPVSHLPEDMDGVVSVSDYL